MEVISKGILGKKIGNFRKAQGFLGLEKLCGRSKISVKNFHRFFLKKHEH